MSWEQMVAGWGETLDPLLTNYAQYGLYTPQVMSSQKNQLWGATYGMMPNLARQLSQSYSARGLSQSGMHAGGLRGLAGTLGSSYAQGLGNLLLQQMQSKERGIGAMMNIYPQMAQLAEIGVPMRQAQLKNQGLSEVGTALGTLAGAYFGAPMLGAQLGGSLGAGFEGTSGYGNMGSNPYGLLGYGNYQGPWSNYYGPAGAGGW